MEVGLSSELLLTFSKDVQVTLEVALMAVPSIIIVGAWLLLNSVEERGKSLCLFLHAFVPLGLQYVCDLSYVLMFCLNVV